MRVTDLRQVMQDMESGIYDFTCNGKCSNCGECCSNFLPISDYEVSRIREYIKKHGIKEQRRNFPLATAALDMTCPFRSESERKCLIYPVRPGICRDFQCDKPRKQIAANKAMYHGKYSVVEMRSTFFGSNGGEDDVQDRR